MGFFILLLHMGGKAEDLFNTEDFWTISEVVHSSLLNQKKKVVQHTWCAICNRIHVFWLFQVSTFGAGFLLFMLKARNSKALCKMPVLRTALPGVSSQLQHSFVASLLPLTPHSGNSFWRGCAAWPVSEWLCREDRGSVFKSTDSLNQ